VVGSKEQLGVSPTCQKPRFRLQTVASENVFTCLVERLKSCGVSVEG
jgi:hypothetical protein